MMKLFSSNHIKNIYTVNMKATYTFSSKDHKSLYSLLINITTNPYHNYLGFKSEVSQLLHKNSIPESFILTCKNICDDRKSRRQLCHYLDNCPIDKNLPVFNHIDPLNDKYSKKRTFVAEGFLQLYANLIHSPLLAYNTRNNGDFFHDVYFCKKYKNTQTQKTDSELYPHNDRTAHPIRADYLQLLGMRNDIKNTIITNYYHGQDIINCLDLEIVNILKKPLFFTPFDPYSKDSNMKQVKSVSHAIIENDIHIRYYHQRTTCLPKSSSEVRKAFEQFQKAITQIDIISVNIQPCMLFSLPNIYGLHERKFVDINDFNEAKKRWLLKTYSFESTTSLKRFNDAYSHDILGLVMD